MKLKRNTSQRAVVALGCLKKHNFSPYRPDFTGLVWNGMENILFPGNAGHIGVLTISVKQGLLNHEGGDESSPPL